MELNGGICSICNSNNEVVKPEDSSIYWELIKEIFKEEIPNLNEHGNNVKICPTCVYKVTLIDSKKAMLSHETRETLATFNNCHLCNSQEHTKVFKVGHSKVMKEFEPYKKLQESGSRICAECYFLMETTYSLKNSLKRLSKSRNSKRRSVENGEKHPEDPVDKSPKKEIETSPVGASNELERDEKKNESTRTPMRTGRNSQKNGQKSVETPEVSSPTAKLRARPKKPELEVITVKDEDLGKREVRVRTLRDKNLSTSNGHLKNSTPKKNVKITDTEHTKTETSDVKLRKLEISKLSSLIPLCAMKLKLSEEIRTDTKFFKLVPYIKLSNSNTGLKKRKGSQNNGASITKANKGPKETKIASKRTPPIKIKFKPGRINIKQNVNVKTKRIRTSANTVEKRKMVVKVARLNLSKSETDKSEEEKEPNENINIIENVVINEDLNSSKDLSTPKRKKKVHFNDTPTIIITGDDNSDQEEKSCTNDNDIVEDEQEDEEMEDITNMLEESDFQGIESTQKQSELEPPDENVEEVKDATEETTNNKTDEESKEEIETQVIDDDEVATEKEQIFEINDEEEDSQNQEIVNLEEENESESPKELGDEENKPDEKSSSDQNSVDKDAALIDLDIIDECSNEEDTEKTEINMDTQSTLGKIIETDTNDDNDVVINNEMLSHAADDKENFGSLIDEVQKCLTSSEDFTSLSKKQDAECPSVEILDDDSLTCLQDLEVLKGSFTEELIQDTDVTEKLPLSSKRGAGSTGSESSPKKSRLN